MTAEVARGRLFAAGTKFSRGGEGIRRRGHKRNMGWSAPASRRLAMVLIAAGMAFLSARATAAAECLPAVLVHGPEQIRTAITVELARAGVHVTPPPGCVAEDVTVSERETGLTLMMIDAYGRVTRRTVSDVLAAAAVIESRTGVDLLVPLLPEGEVLSGERSGTDDGKDDGQGDGQDGKDGGELLAPAAPPVLAPEVVAKVAPASEVHPATRGVTLLVATEMAAGSDNSAWAGLSLSGCVTLGPICLGTLLRFWHDLDASDESANVLHRRDAGEVAVSLDLPFSRGRLAFRPGVELGVGWIHMGGFGAHFQMIDDNEFDHGDVSAGLHVAASLAVSRHWSVEGGLGVNLSLFAHPAPFVIDGVMLPGEPHAYGLASLGLRYGVP